MPDRDGYPTAAELRRIRRWLINTPADCAALLAFVRECWWCSDWGLKRSARRQRVGSTLWRTYRFATGGWSGNEDIIGALERNVMFGMLRFYSAHRGGLYVYRVQEP